MNNQPPTTSELQQLLREKDETIKKLQKSRLGLYWDKEKEPEKVVTDCQENLPVLARIKDKEIKSPSGEDNILIEGDNYHALTCLNYSHQGKIDVIYIDPPYNTGNKDFKYNDRFIDTTDGYRHSKWLNFMEKRLMLAKNLLKETGVIFISIDDNEQANLKLLCDKIFGRENFVANFIWNKKNVVQNDAKFSSTNHEYILSYRKSIIKKKFELLSRTKEMDARYSNPDNDPKGNWTSVALQAKSGSEFNLYEIEFSNGVKWKPVEGTFPRLNKEALQKAYDENRLWFGKSGKNVPRLKKYLSEVKQGIVTNSIWLNEEVGSTQIGKEELKKILEKNIFETPKPQKLTSKCIKLTTKNKDAIILDFFAGSGTTGHAVLALNQQDGGNRKFILCTNNEINGLEKEFKEKHHLSNEEFEKEKQNKSKRFLEWEEQYGICSTVTYPRLKKVIQGYHKNGHGDFIAGLGGQLHYFKTDLIPASDDNEKRSFDDLRDKKRYELTTKAGQMIALKENVFEEIALNDYFQIFESKDKKTRSKKRVGIYFREEKIKFSELVEQLEGFKSALYIFSYGKVDKHAYSYYQGIRIEDIPEPILDVYKQINFLVGGEQMRLW